MPEVRKIQRAGNSLLIIFDDGSRKLAVPTGGSIWIPGIGGYDPTNPDPDPGTEPPPAGGDGKFITPFNWNQVSSEYGPRNGRVHQGIDFGLNGVTSGVDIVAAYDGTVEVATRGHGNQDGSGFGNYVRLNHGVIQGVTLRTVYAHMLAPGALVNQGDTVNRGQVIGKVGNTGNSYGAHLHWETHEGNISYSNPGSHRNPRNFMQKYG